jgi:hypothetical protein
MFFKPSIAEVLAEVEDDGTDWGDAFYIDIDQVEPLASGEGHIATTHFVRITGTVPKLNKVTTVTVAYSPDDIIDLIVRDMATTHKVVVTRDEVKLHLTGGTMYDAAADYSGGSGPDYAVTPVEYDGYSVTSTQRSE